MCSNNFFQGEGCAHCNHTGYAGRIGIYEVLVISPRIREAIVERAAASTITNIAISEGMTTLLEDGLAKAYRGNTTVTEVLRITGATW